MRRRSIGIVITLGALTALLLAPSTEAAQRFELAMTGAEEAPGPGDPDGTGTASFTFNRGLGEVCFSLEVEDIVLPATGAHIHVAPAGSPGPIVIPLTAPGSDGTSSGCVSADRELVKAITKDPASYYVNVHTTDFPGGAVRAQLG